MKQFLIFIQKEFYHIFRDRWTMIILLILPVLMIILFGFGISTEIKNTRFAVYDPSKDVITQEIIHKISQSEYFAQVKNLESPYEIEEQFQQGKTGLVIVFSENFAQNYIHTGNAQIQLIADATDPNTASILTNYASNIINSYQQELMQIQTIPYTIILEVKLLYNPTMKGVYNTVPGIMGMIMMLICAMMTSVSIAREKELGTMEILLASPMKPIFIIISKLTPFFVLSIFNLSTILMLSYFVLKVPIEGSIILLIAFSLLFIILSLSLGLLISTIAQTQLIALLVSAIVLLIPTLMLSGLMFPIESMPKILQYFSHIIPAKWYIIGLRNIMIKGLGISSIINEILILSGIAILLIAVSLKKFKIRLE
ncbi:MAG: ABC transporter permease [Bacteroidales bacterium]|jgi:ABC-2 type transport system permease protein|nr:ABC transporter permease [Bacteroidales bacterium]